MAAAIIQYDRNTEPMRQVARALQMLREGRALLTAVRDVMIQFRDSDGSQDAHYDLLAVAGGFEAGDYASANAAARASFLELDSLHAKLTTDGAVDEVDTAISQACAKHGIAS